MIYYYKREKLPLQQNRFNQVIQVDITKIGQTDIMM